jgi:polyferredoxin
MQVVIFLAFCFVSFALRVVVLCDSCVPNAASVCGYSHDIVIKMMRETINTKKLTKQVSIIRNVLETFQSLNCLLCSRCLVGCNPEMLAALGTQESHSTTTNKAKDTKQKAKKMSNTDPTKTGGVPMCSRMSMRTMS